MTDDRPAVLTLARELHDVVFAFVMGMPEWDALTDDNRAWFMARAERILNRMNEC